MSFTWEAGFLEPPQSSPLDALARDAIAGLTEQKEAWSREICGGEEGARILAQHYCLEEEPLEFVDQTDGAVVARQTVRLRPRNPPRLVD